MAISLLLIVVPTLVAVGALLTVRRFAPPGGVLAGMESADGIFTAAAEALAVLITFVIVLAFQSYANGRNAAGEEAVAAQQLYATAGFFPNSADELRGEVVCYARSVIHEDWPAMARSQESPVTQGWANRLDQTIQQTSGASNRHGAALRNWLQVTQDRLDARRTRLAESKPFIPTFAWVLLAVLIVLVLTFHCLLADPAGTRWGQAAGMAAVAATLFAGVSLVWVLDRPFNDRGAQIAPSRMQASLRVMSHQADLPPVLPCDARGNSR